jgi:L-fuconolactonase
VSAVVDTALEIFGPSRLMYGSDWPISVLAGGHRRIWEALSSCFDQLTPVDRAAVLGGTAQRVYHLPPPRQEPR